VVREEANEGDVGRMTNIDFITPLVVMFYFTVGMILIMIIYDSTAKIAKLLKRRRHN